MKNLKIVLSVMLVSALAISVSAFSLKSYNKKAFATTCYKFNISSFTYTSSDILGGGQPLVDFTTD